MSRMLINAILDRSGSMSSLATDVIGNYNAYIEGLRSVEDGIDVAVSLILFDGEYEQVYLNREITEVPLLDSKTYYVRGSTALLDAVMRTINAVEALPVQPDNVVFVINTDGYENASRETKKEALKQRIEGLTAEKGWQFLFIGAGIDAFGEAATLGVFAANTMSATADSGGSWSTYSTLTAATDTYRTSIRSAGASGQSLNSVSFNLQNDLVPETDLTNAGTNVPKKSRNKKVTNAGNSK